MKTAYLVLSNGRVFEGTRFGADGSPTGELVFTTGMCGYMETLSDPSYYGQIVLQTFPLIGNYGFIPDDMESRGCFVTAYVVREICDNPSNFRSEGTVDAFLKERGIPGLYGVDTREITRIIRETGVMNARIVDAITPESTAGLSAFVIRDAVAAVSERASQAFKPEGDRRFRVALLDFGAKRNIVRELNNRGCEVLSLPYDTAAEDILALRPDGVMLSNGPGDPAENTGVIREIAKLTGRVPMFGICLGHQLLALAQGGKTTKLKYGHRGANQPVKDIKTGRVHITSQNHGYAVVADTLPGGACLRMVNANDDTCEGVDYPDARAFSVQFHPEACAGPRDTAYLFDRFIGLMGGDEYAAE
jgi:carbamoyl-phosphate synthase small subunit